MDQNRTSEMFRNYFKRNTSNAGRSVRYYSEDKYKKKDYRSEDSKLKHEMQCFIMDLISERKSFEDIKLALTKKEEYSKFAQIFDTWIIDAIIKSDRKLGMFIERGITYNKPKEEIIEKIESSNSEIFKTYKEEITKNIESKIKDKEEKIKKQELIKKMKDEEEER